MLLNYERGFPSEIVIIRSYNWWLLQETNQKNKDKNKLTTTVTDMLDPDINKTNWQIMPSSEEDKQQSKPYNANK